MVTLATERLYQFPSKPTCVPTDLLYGGDSANGFNEVNTTIAGAIAAYPVLLGLATLTYGANKFPYYNNSSVLTAGTVSPLAISVLAATTQAAMLSAIGALGLTGGILTGNLINQGVLVTQNGAADQSKVILTPTTGNTITLSPANLTTILNPSGTLATLTVNMPTVGIIDGQRQVVSTTQIITALTVGGGTIFAAPTSLAAGQVFAMIYDLPSTSWYPAY